MAPWTSTPSIPGLSVDLADLSSLVPGMAATFELEAILVALSSCRGSPIPLSLILSVPLPVSSTFYPCMVTPSTALRIITSPAWVLCSFAPCSHPGSLSERFSLSRISLGVFRVLSRMTPPVCLSLFPSSVRPTRHYTVFLSEDSSGDEQRPEEDSVCGFPESFLFSAPFEWSISLCFSLYLCLCPVPYLVLASLLLPPLSSFLCLVYH